MIIFILFFLIHKYKTNTEHYCKVPKKNKQGTDNYFGADLTSAGQENISNNNCNKYWKKFPNEANSNFELNEPVPLPGNEIKLPVEAGVGDNIYKFGLINFIKLSKLLNNKNINKNLYEKANKLIINPINLQKLNYEYEVDFFIENLNKKTDIKRFNEYNPVNKNKFKTIQSPIKNVNLLNNEFLKRINKEQVNVMSKKDKLYHGKLNYQIYSYRIIEIRYIDSNKLKPIYVIQVNLFQEFNYFINSFTYIGFINNKNIIIYNVDFIGVLPNSDFLNTPGNNHNLPTNYFILNKNFNDFQPRLRDVNKVIKIIDNKKKLNVLESNYACFNTNIDSPSTILKYDTKTLCESKVDHYGRPKEVGIYDKPCEKDNECPFYKSNKNYKNNFGGCKNGTCELPVNMKNIGYHYYSYNKNYNPLCYNCKDKVFNLISGNLDDCCDDQFNKKKYKNLKSPDYAFKNDVIKRINRYNSLNYKKKQLI